MFGDILQGVKIVSDIFFDLDKHSDKRKEKWTRENFIELHKRASKLLRSGRIATKHGQLAIRTRQFNDLARFCNSYRTFTDQFKSLGYNPDWDDTDSFFDALEIYVPSFINCYFTALARSFDYVLMYPSISLYEFIHNRNAIMDGRSEQFIVANTTQDSRFKRESGMLSTEQDELFFRRLNRREVDFFYRELEVFLIEVNSSLEPLEESLVSLREYIRNNYGISKIACPDG